MKEFGNPTPAEQNYSQTKKATLSVLDACKRLYENAYSLWSLVKGPQAFWLIWKEYELINPFKFV